MIKTFLLAVLFSLVTEAWSQPKTLIEWTFDTPGDFEGWGWPNHISELQVRDGALQGRIMDWDPFVRSPQFEIPATLWQRVEVRLKTNVGGYAEIFWTNTTESQYGGFSPGKETGFEVVGDNQWHVYQIYPFWHSESKIILLRLDLPRPPAGNEGAGTFAVDWIRVVDLGTPSQSRAEPNFDFAQGTHEWEPLGGGALTLTPEGVRFTNGSSAAAYMVSPPLRVEVGERCWVAVHMAVDRGSTGQILWVSSKRAGLQSARFTLRPDGAFHTYNIDLSDNGAWSGELLMLGILPSSEAGATATVRSITVAEEPQGGPEVECRYVGLENAINRAGMSVPLLLSLFNRGGQPSTDLRIAELQLPPGVRVASQDDWRALPEAIPFLPMRHRILLQSETPMRGQVRLRLTGAGAPSEPVVGEVEFTAPLNLPPAEYVPEPQPVQSDYEIGAFYFPGWHSSSSWEPIRQWAPERKPVLGWYDEGNPECVDWQIKWAVEHGIQFFLVDWYWCAGGRSLEHWLNAYMKARYRSYLKWAIMWANHNPPNTHSEEDQRNVTQYWIDHYFSMPEYYRINDMPVVVIWSPQAMENDMQGRGGARRLLDISQEMAQAAGYKGIWFVAMKWPEASTDPAIIQRLADQGFHMTSIYHYMHHGDKATDPYHFPFDLVAQSSYGHWKAWHEAGILPFLPNLSTGWDSRPWHGDSAVVISGRTVPLFRRICEDARRFADETGVRRMVLGPLNEWGEGSYLEPCKEFGFAMYDALRDVFCKEPPGGWPPNIAPIDVGLGTYDLPEGPPRDESAWDFSDGPQGWGPMMGVADFEASEGAIRFTTISRDPAVHANPGGINANLWRFMVVRMRLEGQLDESDTGQLFWGTLTSGISEAKSVHFPLIADGQFHDYLLPLADNPRWRGRITKLRLDPCSTPGVRVTIDEIRLSQHDQ